MSVAAAVAVWPADIPPDPPVDTVATVGTSGEPGTVSADDGSVVLWVAIVVVLVVAALAVWRYVRRRSAAT